jgi:hypothetical protein
MGLFLANPCPSIVQISNLEVLDQGMSHAKELSGLPVTVSISTCQDSVDCKSRIDRNTTIQVKMPNSVSQQ